jgi:3-methyladenine DNA glycosylase/8-oxoguanine DNA glycosylase
VDDALLLTPGTDVERALDTLRALPGIGEWTAQYIAMRALHWPDAFSISDVAILKAMRESESAQASRACRSVAALAPRTQSSISGNHWRKPNDSSIGTFNHRLHPHAESRR